MVIEIILFLNQKSKMQYTEKQVDELPSKNQALCAFCVTCIVLVCVVLFYFVVFFVLL